MKFNDKKIMVLGGVSILTILILIIFSLFAYIIVTDDDSSGWTATQPDDSTGISYVDTENEINENAFGITNETDVENTLNVSKESTEETESIDEKIDLSANKDTSIEPPLTTRKTFFKVESKLPILDGDTCDFLNDEGRVDIDGDGNKDTVSTDNYENNYLVLEGAEIRTYQNIPNLENYVDSYYKTSGKTNDEGYTSWLPLESKDFSSYDNKNGKIFFVVDGKINGEKQIVTNSDSGNMYYSTTVPDSDYKVIVAKVIPVSYGFGAVLDLSGSLVDMPENDVQAFAFTNRDWNLQEGALYDDGINIYLSTDKNNWEYQTYIKEGAVTDDGKIFTTIRPQILDDFDMTSNGHKTFYIKYDFAGLDSTNSNSILNWIFDEISEITLEGEIIYKVEYDISTSGITNIETTKM